METKTNKTELNINRVMFAESGVLVQASVNRSKEQTAQEIINEVILADIQEQHQDYIEYLAGEGKYL